MNDISMPMISTLTRSMSASRRFAPHRAKMQETERLIADPAPGISATPHEDNLRYFDVVISGPAQSPFEGEFHT